MGGNWLKTGSADAFVMAAGWLLISSGCGSIVLHAMYNVLLRSYAVFVLSHVLSDLCLAQIRRLRSRAPAMVADQSCG